MGSQTRCLNLKWFCCLIVIAMISADETILASLGWTVSFSCNFPPAETEVILQTLENKQVMLYERGAILRDAQKMQVRFEEGENSMDIVIRNVTFAHDGNYFCKKGDDNVEKVTLRVIVKPSAPKIILPRTEILEDSDLDIQCISKGGKPAPDVYWKLISNGTVQMVAGRNTASVMTDQTYLVTNHLRTVATRKLALGIDSLLCAVNTSSRHHQMKPVTLSVNLRPLAPSIKLPNETFIAQRAYTFTCVAKQSRPRANIIWFLGKEELFGKTEAHLRSDGYIDSVGVVILRLRAVHNGRKLRCLVSNHVTEAQNMLPSVATVRIDVKHKPLISVPLAALTVQERADAKLTCIVKANPVLTKYGWQNLDTGREVSANRNQKVSLNRTALRLMVKDITGVQAGRYRCFAKNDMGTEYGKPIALKVLHVPFCEPDQKIMYAAVINQPISLSCNVIANPAENVSFRFHLPNGTSVNVPSLGKTNARTVTSQIQFRARKTSDYGIIRCNASNSVGHMSDYCYLQVIQKLIIFKSCIVNATDSSLLLVCNVIGHNRFLTYELYYLRQKVRVWSSLGINSVPDFQIKDVQASTNYSLRLCASARVDRKDITCSQAYNVTTKALSTEPDDEIKPNGDKKMKSQTMVIILVFVASFIFLVCIGTFVLCFFVRFHRRDQTQVGEYTSKGKHPPSNKDKGKRRSSDNIRTVVSLGVYFGSEEEAAAAARKNQNPLIRYSPMHDPAPKVPLKTIQGAQSPSSPQQTKESDIDSSSQENIYESLLTPRLQRPGLAIGVVGVNPRAGEQPIYDRSNTTESFVDPMSPKSEQFDRVVDDIQRLRECGYFSPGGHNRNIKYYQDEAGGGSTFGRASSASDNIERTGSFGASNLKNRAYMASEPNELGDSGLCVSVESMDEESLPRNLKVVRLPGKPPQWDGHTT